MRVTFDEFVLDTGTRELSREGRRLDLTPKAFELLAILIAYRPRIVTKTDLQERLWPDRFVVDKNLANLVSEIRDALGDDPSNPRFVRTAHRIGYAFRHRGGTEDPRKRPGRGDARIFRLMWDDQRLTLPEGEYVLGRDPDADVYLESPSVSRRHAIVRITGRDATIEDLGSRNGTFVGERRIDKVSTLENGDAIRAGTVVLTFSAVHAPASTKSVGSK
jgi:DNA-binding winged helix-turn-helix (wHTH) protein